MMVILNTLQIVVKEEVVYLGFEITQDYYYTYYYLQKLKFFLYFFFYLFLFFFIFLMQIFLKLIIN